jgi:phosphoenolpyruvate synthase/pyruvate phosphate dikinase
VYGAILVQRAAQASSAGVMITAHPTDPLEKTTFTINAKKGFGMSVVDGKKVPEILLYNFHNDALRVVSRSAEDTMLVSDPNGGVRAVKNPNPGQAILSAVQARLLGRAGRRITKSFPKEAAIDIEWVFVGDQLNIVQARPYVSKQLE